MVFREEIIMKTLIVGGKQEKVMVVKDGAILLNILDL